MYWLVHELGSQNNLGYQARVFSWTDVAFGPGKIRSIHIRQKHINQCSLSYCCWDGVLVWSFIHCITCSGVVRNIKKAPKASFISESLCILSCFLRMFISSATITENYTTYWEKVKSTVITGPPAEYVVRGVSTESFQVSLTGQTLSN